MLVLAETLTLYTVQDCVSELLEYLNTREVTEEKEAVLDASKLRDIDTAGLQLLLSAGKTAFRKGLRLRIVNASESLSRILELSGAGDVLGCEPCEA